MRNPVFPVKKGTEDLNSYRDLVLLPGFSAQIRERVSLPQPLTLDPVTFKNKNKRGVDLCQPLYDFWSPHWDSNPGYRPEGPVS